MKNLLLASFVVLPGLTFAGGIGGVSLSDYNISAASVSSSSLEFSSEAPIVTPSRTVSDRSATRRRSSGGFRSRATATRNYWDWVNARRTNNNVSLGVTRTTAGSYSIGDAYELSTGLQPIDPKDNMYRGQSREDVRQSAAQLKMLRLRGLR